MNWKKILSITLGLSLIAAALLFALPATPVAAQTPTPQPKTPAAAGARADKRLEKLFQAAQKLLDHQAKNLEQANKFGANVADRIAKMKAAGKDTTTIEAALTQFQTNVTQAQQKHDSAATVIAAHAGFDANGQVTDRAAARATLKDAGGPLREARRMIAQALKTVKDALKDLRPAKP
jgi:hypothetical protein